MCTLIALSAILHGNTGLGLGINDSSVQSLTTVKGSKAVCHATTVPINKTFLFLKMHVLNSNVKPDANGHFLRYRIKR